MSTSTIFLILLCSLFLPSQQFEAVDLEDLASNITWVITKTEPCSATCGLGIRKQHLCPPGTDDEVDSTECLIRPVECLDNWQCGLETETAIVGQHLELDCLEGVMNALGRFAFVVSWRLARGIISTNDRLFQRFDVPGLDRVILDPVEEKDAGTYRCDVLDTSFRRLKRMYKGVKVVSPNVLSLDFSKGLEEWEKPGDQWENVAVPTGKVYPSSMVRNVVLLSLSISIFISLIIFLTLFLRQS